MPRSFSQRSRPRLKSGASMPMNTSGFQSNRRRRRAPRSRSRRGRCESTSARPMTASSDASNQVSISAARIASPPTPANSASGKRSRSARIRPAPNWSPDASPATSAIRTGAVTGSAQQRPLAAVDEVQQCANVRAVLGQRGQLPTRISEVGAGHIQRAIRPLDGSDALDIEAAAFEAFAVDGARVAVAVLRHQHEGWNVAVDHRAHTDERMRADPAELMHADEAAEDDVVADLDMPGERRIVRKHAVAADLAVVRDVHVGQQPVVVADSRRATAVVGAAADGDEFADRVAVADHEVGPFTGEFLVLRIATDGREAMDPVVAADRRWTGDAAMRADLSPVRDAHVGPDDAEGADADAMADVRAGIDHGAGMDAGLRASHAQLFTSAQRISADATCTPSTRATPSYIAMLRMTRVSETSSSSRSPGTTMREKRALSIFTR